MISPVLPFGALTMTQMGYQSTAVMFGANEARMALANNPGNRSMGELASLDKALQFQGIAAQVNFAASQAMLENTQGLMKKNNEQRRRMIANGSVLV